MHTVSSLVLLVTIENQMRNSRKDKGLERKHSVHSWKRHELFLGMDLSNSLKHNYKTLNSGKKNRF